MSRVAYLQQSTITFRGMRDYQRPCLADSYRTRSIDPSPTSVSRATCSPSSSLTKMPLPDRVNAPATSRSLQLPLVYPQTRDSAMVGYDIAAQQSSDRCLPLGLDVERPVYCHLGCTATRRTREPEHHPASQMNFAIGVCADHIARSLQSCGTQLQDEYPETVPVRKPTIVRQWQRLPGCSSTKVVLALRTIELHVTARHQNTSADHWIVTLAWCGCPPPLSTSLAERIAWQAARLREGWFSSLASMTNHHFDGKNSNSSTTLVLVFLCDARM